MTNSIPHWVDGAEFTGTSGQWADVTNPATGHVSGRVALANRADALITCTPDRRSSLAITVSTTCSPEVARVFAMIVMAPPSAGT